MPKEKSEKETKISKKPSLEDFEKKVIELGKTGLTSEKIGEALRKEGFHPKEHENKISKILKEKGAYSNSDLKNVEEKFKKIEKHIETNKQDKRSIREKSRIFSQLRKLKKYHKLI